VPKAAPESIYRAEAEDSICLNTLPYAIRARLSEFTGAELKLLLCLLSHANRKEMRVWAGMKLMLRETGLSKFGLDAAIAGLKKKGWIKRFQIVNEKTGQRMTTSTFCKWPPPVPGTMWARLAERKDRNG
jgi:hypothetical protein